MPPDAVDFRKPLRDVIRGAVVDSDVPPIPIGGPLSPDDEHDNLCEVLSDAEMSAYVELVLEVKAEMIAAGERRNLVWKWIDDVVAEVAVIQTGQYKGRRK